MTMTERMEGLRAWVYETLCKGREMKAPGKTDTEIKTAEPRAFANFYPVALDRTTGVYDAASTTPGILIMLGKAQARRNMEQRFDRYSGIKRPAELSGAMLFQFLFSIYEPGDREADFQYTGDPAYLHDAGADGMYQVMDWADELIRRLTTGKIVPGTDLAVIEDTITFMPYQEMNAIADRRPLYYGFVNAEFSHFVGEAPDEGLAAILDS